MFHPSIPVLQRLSEYLLSGDKKLEEVKTLAFRHNKWFTPENIKLSLKAIAENYLQPELLEKWIKSYPEVEKRKQGKRIGLIMAGNIPLAGFHDFLCVIISGNIAVMKLSSKDRILLPHLTEKLTEFSPDLKEKFEYAEMLKNFDAVIATGSNNSSRYFNFYFGKYPHIIRKNRNSVAILTGNETKEELTLLGSDIFRYFGLGCRSVSKIYVPLDYSFDSLFESLESFNALNQHNGYKNNFDYNLTLHILNKTPYLASDFLILSENPSLTSPIAELHYEYYSLLEDALQKTKERKNEIQCVVAGSQIPGAVSFGKSQQPQLWDYADNVDTIEFLNGI